MAKSKKATPTGFVVGKSYFIRTVTHHYTGKLIARDGDFLVLSSAAWIADNGRFSEAMAKGLFGEVEPYPDSVLVRVNLGAVCDVADWNHPLPREVR